MPILKGTYAFSSAKNKVTSKIYSVQDWAPPDCSLLDDITTAGTQTNSPSQQYVEKMLARREKSLRVLCPYS